MIIKGQKANRLIYDLIKQKELVPTHVCNAVGVSNKTLAKSQLDKDMHFRRAVEFLNAIGYDVELKEKK